MTRRKTGPIGPAEAAVIRAKAATLTAGEIAAELGRTEAIVAKWISANMPRASLAGARPKDEIKSELKRGLKWQYLREELTENEVVYFEERYSEYVQQFREDILPTEEDQIFSMIKLDIAIHRNRKDVARMRSVIEQLEADWKDLPRERERDDVQRARAREIEQLLGNYRNAERGLEDAWLKQSKEIRSLQEELKATRQQRVSRVESARESFVEVLKNLADPEFRRRTGIDAEFARAATDKEEKRLTGWHRFADGKLDQPILTAETALEESGD